MRIVVVVTALVLAVSAEGTCPLGPFAAPPNYIHGSVLAVGDFDRDGRVDTLSATPGRSAVQVNLGRPGGTFQPATSIEIESQIERQAVSFTGTAADVDADGILDLVLGVGSTGAIEVHLGRGDATFEPARTLTYLWEPIAVVAADFDGDGRLDVAAAGRHDRRVDVMWGNGDGTFSRQPLNLKSDLSSPSDLAAGDINGDGRADLIAGGRMDRLVEIRLGGSARTLTRTADLEVGAIYSGLTVADIEGDGHLDLAVAAHTGSRVGIFRGNGDGTFRQRVDHASPSSAPEGITIGDIDGDAVNDIIVGVSGGIAVFSGRGNGSFAFPVQYVAGNNTRALFVADLNDDGRNDLIVGDYMSYSVLLQSGDHRLDQLPSRRLTATVWDITAADLNGDGRADIIVPMYETGRVAILLAERGDAPRVLSFAHIGTDPTTIHTADLNRDGKLDLVAGILGGVAVAFGTGDGHFAWPVTTSLAYLRYTTTVGDADGDGDIDVLAVDRIDNVIHLLANDGAGGLSRARDIRANRVPGGILLTDLDGDGRNDLVTTEDTARADYQQPGFVVVRRGRGNGVFDAAVEYAAGTEPANVSAADFDGDGRLDLAVGEFAPGGGVRLYRGTGRGTFRAETVLPSYGQVAEIAVADFDRDGDADMAFANTGLVVVYESLGAWRFAEPRAHVGSIAPLFLTTGDFDGDGRIDIATPGRFGEITVQLNGSGCRRRSARR